MRLSYSVSIVRCTIGLFCLFLCSSCYAQTENKVSNPIEANKENSTKPNEPSHLQNTDGCDFSAYKTLKRRPSDFIYLPKPIPNNQKVESKQIVVIKLLSDKNGKIIFACKVSGDDSLAEFALKAARGIKSPSKDNQRILDRYQKDYFEFTIDYVFHADETPEKPVQKKQRRNPSRNRER